MNIITNYGPKTWIENRDDGVVTSVDVKVRGWRIINNEDGSPKTYKQYNIRREDGEGFIKLYKGFDFTQMAEVEETYTYTVPEEHQTDKVFYLNAEHVHDHTQGDDGDIEYQTKEKEWRKDLKEDSVFLAKIESVKTQLEALGEE